VIDDDGRWWCDRCGQRCARGGIQVSTPGSSFTLRRLRAGDGVIYCSERCVRDALFGLDPDEDPAEALRRQIAARDRAARRDQEQLDEELRRAQGPAAQLDRVRDLVALIDTDLLASRLGPDEADQQQLRVLRNLGRIVRVK
jgi:hypothetical protein